MDTILLQNMVFYAHHGVYQEEQKLGQRFFVDVELAGDFAHAGQQDCLTATVDYTAVYRLVQQTVENERFQLLEALAERLAAQILAVPKVAAVTVRIRKPAVAIPGPLDYVQVQICREKRR